jgi:hypothetical protein
MIKVLVACEFSGIVRDAFRDQGHQAFSCDLRQTEKNSEYHIQRDVLTHLERKGSSYDLMVAHPPCTYLSNSGVRWLYEKEERWQKMINGAVFFRKLLNYEEIPHIAVENPIMHSWGKKVIGEENSQTVQPWQFGDKEKKAVCLWLDNLPELEETENVKEEVEKMPESEAQKKYHLGSGNSKERSRFFPGIAEAMAKQWGDYVDE